MCWIAKIYDQMFFNLPFIVGNFKLTNLYHTVQKILGMTLIEEVAPLIYAKTLNALTLAGLLSFLGLRLILNDLEFSATSIIEFSKNLKTRLPNTYKIVVINNQCKLSMAKPS